MFHVKPLYLSSLKLRLSSLTIGDSERKSSATQQREPTTEVPAESTGKFDFPRWVYVFLLQDRFRISLHITSFCPPLPGPGLVQRCVVVQKDQLGFGFTVCGERVKLVQNVRPGETCLNSLCYDHACPENFGYGLVVQGSYEVLKVNVHFQVLKPFGICTKSL